MAKRQKRDIEVRRDPPSRSCPEGEIDEICGHGQFHLERMNESDFALMLYGENGDTMCVWFTPTRAAHRSNGARPHTRVCVGWHDTAADWRQYGRDNKKRERDERKAVAAK